MRRSLGFLAALVVVTLGAFSGPALAAEAKLAFTSILRGGAGAIVTGGTSSLTDGKLTTYYRLQPIDGVTTVTFSFDPANLTRFRVNREETGGVWSAEVLSPDGQVLASGLSLTHEGSKWYRINLPQAPVGVAGKVRLLLDATGVYTLNEAEVYGDAVDSTPPQVPSGLSVTPGYEQVVLTWSPSASGDTVGYRVYRDGVHVGTASGTTYTDSGLIPGRSYSYTVTAYDAAGNESAHSEAASAVPLAPPDTTAPDAPTGLTATAGELSISLTWTASTATDVQGYKIYRDGQLLLGQSGIGYTDTGLEAGRTYTYTVTAVDTSGNESAPSAPASAVPLEPPPIPDTTPPAPPVGLTATAGNAMVSLSWSTSSDSDVTGYRVYRDGTKVAEVSGTTYTDTTALNGTTYRYTVTAFDAAGNESDPSDPVTATPMDPLVAPGPPRSLKFQPGPRAVTLNWAPPSTGGKVDTYRVYRDTSLIGTTTATTWRDNSVQPEQRYLYAVTAMNSVGESPQVVAEVTTPRPGALDGVQSDLAGIAPAVRSGVTILLPFFLAAAGLIIAFAVLRVGITWTGLNHTRRWR